MGKLIDDLLGFSKLGRIDIRKSHVDMNELVTEVIDEMKSGGIKFPKNLVLRELTPTNCDRALIKQVWINLISNAIKYSGGKETPVIEIGMTSDSMSAYFIQDNGAGFDMNYGHKLFGVFQRLHREGEFEGTGVGLAIVKRIVDHHNGKVWAEGQKGVGAKFYFSLAS